MFDPGCPQEMIYFNRSCYNLNTTFLKFEEARKHCETKFVSSGRKGYLVDISSEQENNAVARMWTNKDLWIGYYKQIPSLTGMYGWEWLHSKIKYPNGYTNWAPGEPNGRGGSGDKRCALIWGESKWRTSWDDRGCEERKASVCEVGKFSKLREHLIGFQTYY